jgi:hypothetical protein
VCTKLVQEYRFIEPQSDCPLAEAVPNKRLMRAEMGFLLNYLSKRLRAGFPKKVTAWEGPEGASSRGLMQLSPCHLIAPRHHFSSVYPTLIRTGGVGPAPFVVLVPLQLHSAQ